MEQILTNIYRVLREKGLTQELILYPGKLSYVRTENFRYTKIQYTIYVHFMENVLSKYFRKIAFQSNNLKKKKECSWEETFVDNIYNIEININFVVNTS
jgi:hypothetical protein